MPRAPAAGALAASGATSSDFAPPWQPSDTVAPLATDPIPTASHAGQGWGPYRPQSAACERGVSPVQGVIKSYDPASRDGIVVRDTDLSEVDLAPNALDGSVFRLLRQGQRVIFDLDGEGRATHLRLGSEVDMGTPGLDPERFPVGDEATSG